MYVNSPGGSVTAGQPIPIFQCCRQSHIIIHATMKGTSYAVVHGVKSAWYQVCMCADFKLVL